MKIKTKLFHFNSAWRSRNEKKPSWLYRDLATAIVPQSLFFVMEWNARGEATQMSL